MQFLFLSRINVQSALSYPLVFTTHMYQPTAVTGEYNTAHAVVLLLHTYQSTLTTMYMTKCFIILILQNSYFFFYTRKQNISVNYIEEHIIILLILPICTIISLIC